MCVPHGVHGGCEAEELFGRAILMLYSSIDRALQLRPVPDTRHPKEGRETIKKKTATAVDCAVLLPLVLSVFDCSCLTAEKPAEAPKHKIYFVQYTKY